MHLSQDLYGGCCQRETGGKSQEASRKPSQKYKRGCPEKGEISACTGAPSRIEKQLKQTPEAALADKSPPMFRDIGSKKGSSGDTHTGWTG